MGTTVQGVLDFLADKKPSNFGDCIVWARKQFEERYVNQIKQLLHNFPPDQKTSSGKSINFSFDYSLLIFQVLHFGRAQKDVQNRSYLMQVMKLIVIMLSLQLIYTPKIILSRRKK